MNRRLELVVLDLIQHCRSRTALGWGKYPYGMRDAIERLLPLVNPEDPAVSAINTQWQDLKEKLESG